MTYITFLFKNIAFVVKDFTSLKIRIFIRHDCLAIPSSRTGARLLATLTAMAVLSLLTWEGLLLFFGFIHIHCFNVDVRMPFIKQGPENSYFGFSIAQHKINDSGQYL